MAFGQIRTTENAFGDGNDNFGEMTNEKKLCGIELNIKYTVVNAPDSDGNAGRYFYPVGETVITKEGDKWGDKGQGGRGQELELEILGCEVKWPPSIEIDMDETTLDQSPDASSVIDISVSAWFECCVCGDDDCETCCTEDNMTSPGDGDHCHLGAWRTGHGGDLFGNKMNRTPTYAVDFAGDSPEDAKADLQKEIKSLVRSDIISDVAKSYINTSCD